MSKLPTTNVEVPQGLDVATLASGCYWCTEAIYQDLKGVEQVISGYSGGHIVDPSYEEVCTGTTGHAECTQILFDPKVISFQELLEIFWSTHDPTTLNRQGGDVGHSIGQPSFTIIRNRSNKQNNLSRRWRGAEVLIRPLSKRFRDSTISIQLACTNRI